MVTMSRKTVRQVTGAAILFGLVMTAWGLRQWWLDQPIPLSQVGQPLETNQDRLEQAIDSVQLREPSPEVLAQREVVLSEMSESAQSGFATISETEGDRVKITIQITEPRFDEPQPAFIHQGTCEARQEVAFPLNSVIMGSSVTSLDQSIEDILVANQAMVIVVGLSAAEPSRIVACGQL